jgi:hypothetical protein
VNPFDLLRNVPRVHGGIIVIKTVPEDGIFVPKYDVLGYNSTC